MCLLICVHVTHSMSLWLPCRYIPWVHYESPEEVGPCDVVHCVLFSGDGSSNDLSIQMVCQHLQQAKHWDGRGGRTERQLASFPGSCAGLEKRAWYTLFAHTQLFWGFWEFCKYYTVSLFCPSSITIHCNSTSKDGGAVTRVRQNFRCKDTVEFLHLQAKSHWKPLGDTGSYTGKVHVVAPYSKQTYTVFWLDGLQAQTMGSHISTSCNHTAICHWEGIYSITNDVILTANHTLP